MGSRANDPSLDLSQSSVSLLTSEQQTDDYITVNKSQSIKRHLFKVVMNSLFGSSLMPPSQRFERVPAGWEVGTLSAEDGALNTLLGRGFRPEFRAEVSNPSPPRPRHNNGCPFHC